MQQIIILIISVSDKNISQEELLWEVLEVSTNRSKGFLVATIQMPVPIINSRADIDKQVKEIVRTLHATKAGYPGAELIIFPEYSTQGLNTSKWLTEEFCVIFPELKLKLLQRLVKKKRSLVYFLLWNVIQIRQKSI
ncbi:MAG: hypothetical protein ACLVHS_07905 [Blautia wexlerae]